MAYLQTRETKMQNKSSEIQQTIVKAFKNILYGIIQEYVYRVE